MNGAFAIALITFRESIRSKVLYVTLFFGVALILITTLFGSVTVGDQVKVIKDFGLFAISLCTIGYAIVAGSALLFKELSRKTIYNILSKPVHRSEFIWGKYLGMLATSTTMLCIMGAGLSGYVALFEGTIDTLLIHAYLFSFLELIVVCAGALFFSSIVVTPLLSGMFTLGFFLAGRSTEYLLYFIKEGAVTEEIGMILRTLYYVVPHLNNLSIANLVVYGNSATLEYTLYSALYAGGYALTLLLFSLIAFSKKEFN